MYHGDHFIMSRNANHKVVHLTQYCTSNIYIFLKETHKAHQLWNSLIKENSVKESLNEEYHMQPMGTLLRVWWCLDLLFEVSVPSAVPLVPVTLPSYHHHRLPCWCCSSGRLGSLCYGSYQRQETYKMLLKVSWAPWSVRRESWEESGESWESRKAAGEKALHCPGFQMPLAFSLWENR